MSPRETNIHDNDSNQGENLAENVVAAIEPEEQGGNSEEAVEHEVVVVVVEPTATTTTTNPWKNRNVILTLLWCVTAGVADSIWGNTILSAFLLALAQAMHGNNNDKNHDDDNTLVGTAEAIQGIAMLISALPVGLIADWYGKSRMVAYGGVLFAVTIIINLVALVKAKRAVVVTDDEDDESPNALLAKHAYKWMLVALALWGIGQGIIAGPAQALFADSIPKGQRSALMTWQYTIYLLSSMTGPIIGLCMLANRPTEDSWSLTEIYPVFVVGVLLEIPGIIIMFFFRDDQTVVEQEEGERENTNEESSNTHQIANNATASTPVTTPVTRAVDSLENDNDLETPLLLQQEHEDIDNAPPPGRVVESDTTPRTWHKVGKASIPYVLFLASLVTSLGSGASVKYFPLFFRELGFSSAFVQGIYVIVPLSISLFSFAAQRASKRLGRIETTVFWELVGISLLYYMTWLSRNETVMSNFQKYQVIAVYLLRTGLMNAGYPLLESVLMDALPSNRRARFKSLEAVAAFGWTGSALVGGILADERSYRFTFAITASLQLVGTLMLLPLQPFVEPEAGDSEEEPAQEESNTTGPTSTECD